MKKKSAGAMIQQSQFTQLLSEKEVTKVTDFEEKMKKYDRNNLNLNHVAAYLLQIARRPSNSGSIAREYYAEKVLRTVACHSEFHLVSELDLHNLEIYDNCLKEIIRASHKY